MDAEHSQHSGVVILIDRKEYKTPADELTGEQIRGLAKPPIGAGRDLWQEVPGGHDRLITNDEVVELKNGMHFFSAPSTINPG